MPSTPSALRNLAQRAVRALVLHGGGAGDDAEGGVLGEHGGELVGHAVGEVVLSGIAGEIVEGKDGEGLDVEVAARVDCSRGRAVRQRDDEGKKERPRRSSDQARARAVRRRRAVRRLRWRMIRDVGSGSVVVGGRIQAAGR